MRLVEFPGPLQVPLPNLRALDKPRPCSLILLSPNGDELRGIRLPVRGTSKKERWEAIASTSGEFILATHVEDENREYTLIEAETLSSRATWSITEKQALRPQAFSGEHLLYVGTDTTFLGAPNGPIERIGVPNGKNQFLRDDLILTVSPRPWAVSLTRTSGERLTHFDLGISDRDGAADMPFVSADGRRFGTVARERGDSKLFVWQVPDNQPIFTVPVKYFITQGTVAALAPDDLHLAFINNGSIFVYALPASTIPVTRATADNGEITPD